MRNRNLVSSIRRMNALDFIGFKDMNMTQKLADTIQTRRTKTSLSEKWEISLVTMRGTMMNMHILTAIHTPHQVVKKSLLNANTGRIVEEN